MTKLEAVQYTVAVEAEWPEISSVVMAMKDVLEKNLEGAEAQLETLLVPVQYEEFKQYWARMAEVPNATNTQFKIRLPSQDAPGEMVAILYTLSGEYGDKSGLRVGCAIGEDKCLVRITSNSAMKPQARKMAQRLYHFMQWLAPADPTYESESTVNNAVSLEKAFGALFE